MININKLNFKFYFKFFDTKILVGLEFNLLKLR